MADKSNVELVNVNGNKVLDRQLTRDYEVEE
jgi:hypothetical protein